MNGCLPAYCPKSVARPPRRAKKQRCSPALSDWQERCSEVTGLAPRADESAAAACVLSLLLDREKTAVTQAAAEALLERGDLVDLRLVAKAFRVADQDMKNKLGYCPCDDERPAGGGVGSLLHEVPDVGMHSTNTRRGRRRNTADGHGFHA